MADGRICDGIGFAQIKPDLRCASMPDRSDHSSTEAVRDRRHRSRAAAERDWPGEEGRPSCLGGHHGYLYLRRPAVLASWLGAGLAAFRREPVLALVCDHAWCAADD